MNLFYLLILYSKIFPQQTEKVTVSIFPMEKCEETMVLIISFWHRERKKNLGFLHNFFTEIIRCTSHNRCCSVSCWSSFALMDIKVSKLNPFVKCNWSATHFLIFHCSRLKPRLLNIFFFYTFYPSPSLTWWLAIDTLSHHYFIFAYLKGLSDPQAFECKWYL